MKIFMPRFFLLFIVVLLCFCFDANAQELVLEKVSVDTVELQQIKLTWQFIEGVDSVVIYKRNEENKYIMVAKVKLNDLEWIDEEESPTSQNYYCINWELSALTPPQNNMVLKTTLSSDGCPNSLSIAWNPYINMTDTLDYYNIFYRKIENTPSSFELLTATKKTEYIAKYLDNNTIYEFVVQAISKTDTIFAFSNMVRDTTKFVPVNPDTLYISRVNVVEDKLIEIEIMTNDLINPQNVKNLYLYRGVWNLDSISFNCIDSLPHSANNQYHFTDLKVEPKSKLYYYQAIVEHKCKPSDYSNTLTNILLNGFRVEDEKYQDSLYFYHVGAEPFETYNLLVNGEEWATTFPLTVENNKCLIDVEQFLYGGFEMKYQIRSENSCFSNTLIIPHEPLISFPNAFYPQGLEPDKTFYPIILFPSEDHYLFIIYNRWGQELYRSTQPPVYREYGNMQGRWDGTFKGKECPAGIYAYKISYNYNEGKGRYSDSGTFMLVR